MGYYLLGFEPEADGPRRQEPRRSSVEVSSGRRSPCARAGLLSIPATAPSAQRCSLSARCARRSWSAGWPVAGHRLRAAGRRRAGRCACCIAARGGRAQPARERGLRAVGRGRQGGGEPGLAEGIAGGDGECGGVLRGEADGGPGDVQRCASRRSTRRAARQRASTRAKAALVSAGGLEISDLVLAPSSAGGAVRPAVDLEARGRRAARRSWSWQAAIRPASRERRSRSSWPRSADGPALLRAPVEAGAADKDGTRAARASTLAAGLLPPGDYVARAEVSVEGKPVAS